MSFEIISRITKDKPIGIAKSLSYGYIKSLNDVEVIDLMIKHALNKQYSSFIIRRVFEINNDFLLDKLANNFLSLYISSDNYKDKRRLSYFLNGILDACSKPVQTEILIFFLKSGKRYIRKYAYSKKLANYNLFDCAWSLIEKNTEEATYLIKTIAYQYDDSFIITNFDRLISHPCIEEYQIRKLFIRHPQPGDENWLWLKNRFPHSFLYIAAIKNYAVNSDDCLKILGSLNADDEFSPNIIANTSRHDEGLTLWCLAKMGQWEVIEKIISTRTI